MACDEAGGSHRGPGGGSCWLVFENEHGRFPLYPGESVWIESAYTVADDKWGNWFQRAVPLPTEQLEVQLVFPAALDPVVAGCTTGPDEPSSLVLLLVFPQGLFEFVWVDAGHGDGIIRTEGRDRRPVMF